MLGPKGSWRTTVIPDSEDERQVQRNLATIEIPTDSSEDESSQPQPQVKGNGKWEYRSPSKPTGRASVSVRRDGLPSTKKNFSAGYLRSRVVESSESESDEVPSKVPKPSRQVSQQREENDTMSSSGRPKATPTFIPLKKQSSSMIVEVESGSDDDDAILVFDEPPSARKPLRKPPPKTSMTVGTTTAGIQVALPSTSRDIFGSSDTELDTPSTAPPANPSPRKKAAGTPRVSKKKKKEEEQQGLYNYAASFFEELNQTVFKQQLPGDTKLNWNKRLLTTAGRAKWHRSRDGVQTSEIELAEKILTSRERIRNTLSHEMCHLASWVIDKQIKEAHGRYWKSWTRRVMSKYPDIDISTRHDYDIEYPYKWKCAKCDKIYGRFSKSIKPNECVCGVCREGRLIPQFTTNTRAPKTPRVSRMAAAKPQDSPFTPTKRAPAHAPVSLAVGPVEVIEISSDSEDDWDEPPTRLVHTRASICEIPAFSDPDSDIEVLALTLGATTILD